MSYLLDTNVIFELVRPRPAPAVEDWIGAVPDGALHLSVLSLGEIRNGAESTTEGRNRERLRIWLEQDLPSWFEDRLLPITTSVADRWSRLLAEAGRPVPAIESLLAATALDRDLRLVTRNEMDFQFPGLTVVNPWALGIEREHDVVPDRRRES